MTKRYRDLKRDMAAIAAVSGAELQAIERTGKSHYRTTFRMGGRNIVVFSSASPSDYRAGTNHRTLVHRLLRNGGRQPS
jgi:hypothetical protein